MVQLCHASLRRRDESHSINRRKPPQRQRQDIFLRVAGKVDTDMLSSARSFLCSHPCNTPSVKGSVAKDVRHLMGDVFKCEKHCLLKILSLYVSQLVRDQSHSTNSGNIDQDSRKARRWGCRLCREVGLSRAQLGSDVQTMICMGLSSRCSDRGNQLALDWEVHQLAAL